MLELFKSLFAGEPFIPHGHCYLWKPQLVGLHIVSDLLIAVAYYSIAITLLYFVRKRQDLPYSWIFLLFSAFIVACGTTHLMEIWTLWHPTYWLSGYLKAITAFVSVVTAIELVPLIPKALALPSPAQLEAANRELEREIGERKIAQAALQEREQFLNNIYNSVTDTLWVVEQLEDGEFQLVSMNRAIETSTGILAEHWIGKRLDELWDLQTAATIRARYHDCLQQGQTISYEENLLFGSHTRCFLTTLTPLQDPDSRTRLLGVSMDITERKRAEEELRWKETLLRSMTDASPLAFYVVDNRTDNILYFNHRFCKIWGIEHLEELMRRGQLKNNDIIPDCLPVLADVPAFAESCKPLQSEENRAVVEDEIPFNDGRTIRRFSTQIRDGCDRYFGRLYLFEDVTERKQIEEKLLLADFSLECASLATVWIDRDAKILRANAAACEQIGYSREELLAMRVWDVNPNFPIEAWPQHWQDLKEQKKLLFTSEERRKDGSFIPVEIALNYLEFNGKEYNFACIRDIRQQQAALRDREQAEAALRESEARFQAFMDYSPAAAWITDKNGKLLYFSQTYARIFNVPNNLVGKIDLSIHPPEFKKEYLKNIRKVVETNQILEAIEPGLLADGSIGKFLAYKFPLPSASGEVLVGGVAIDITERKKAEAALQQREQEFRALVENAPDIIMRLDRECRYLYINPTVEQQSGIPPAAFIGKTVEELGSSETLVNLWRTAIEQVFETGCEQSIEYEISSGAGITYYASRVVPEFGSDGSVQSVLAIARDISNLKLAEAALKQARDELEIRVIERTAQLVIANQDLQQEISNRQQAQAALQASEARLKAVLDNTAAFISSARIHPDKPWEYEYCSPNGAEIFGYKGEEFAADPSLWLSRISPEDMEAIVQPAMADLYAGRQITIEYRFRHKEGSWRWLSNTLLAKKHPSEDYWFATGVVIDITERKQAEKALQESEQRFATLAKTAPVGIFRNDTRGYCLYGNERCLQMVGLSLEELIGEGWLTALHPDDRDRVITAWYSFVQQGIPYSCEIRLQRRDGSIIWVLAQAIAETDADGNIIGYIGTLTDITERKQAEKFLKDYNQILEMQVQERTAELSRINADLEQEIVERQRSQTALQESEQRYRTLIAAMAEGIVLQDADGTIRTCNASAKRILRLSRKQMMGRTSLDPTWQAIREDGSPFPGEEHPAMVTLRTGKACSNVVMGVHKPDGSFTWISINSQPLFRAGEPLPYAVVSSFADITARKQAEEALRESEARYRAILEDQTELIARLLPTGTITYVNEAYCQFFGVTRQELVGYNYQPVVHEEDREYVAKCVSNINWQNPVVTIENRVIACGKIRWTQWINRGIFDDKGQLIELQAVGRDISDRKQAEENLRRYEKIVAATTDAICLIDRNYTYQVVNQAYLNWHQGRQEEVIGHTVSEVLGSDLFENQIKPRVTQCFSGETIQYEMWIKYPNGQEKFLSATYAPYVEADGTISGVVASLRNLTELKQMEAALQQSESTLRAFFDSSVMMMGIVELYEDDFLHLSANPATAQFFGTTPEAMQNQFVGNSGMPRSLLQLWLSRYWEAVKTQAPIQFEYAHETPTGQKWLSASVCPITIGSNGRPRLSYIVEDVSDRKQAEEALRQSESTLRSFFDSGSMMMGIIELYDHDIRHLSDNLLAARFFGKTPEQTKNRFASEMGVLPAHIQQWSERYREALHTQAAVRFEYPHETPTQHKWLSASVCPIGIGPNGRPRLSYIIEDISDRKQMEQALQESNERFQLAASAVKGFIYDWDITTNRVLRTQGLFDAVGYYPEEAKAHFDWWHEHVHPEDLPKVSQQLSQAFASETQSYYVLEYRLRHRNGHYVYLSDYGAIARDADRRAIRAVGHSIDVSELQAALRERKQAETTLQKALQVAQDASIAKSRFLSNMSHELRTPLNAILGFSQMLVRSQSLSPDQKEQLKIINRSGEHLLNLINDILSVAKIEAGQTTLNENRFDLYQLLDDLEQMLKLKATSKGLQLIFERASDLPQYVQTDENKLRQVLINLLGNAIKFTTSGYVVLRAKRGKLSRNVSPQKTKPEANLLFEVEDTGPGIAGNEIGTLFDPFVQAEIGRKSMQGTGLGLTISREFIQMMGGKIAVSSQLDKGSIFTFDILALEVAEVDKKRLSTTQRAIGLEPNQPVYRILVVEDVEENRQLLFQLLEPLGFQVRRALNGREAIVLWLTWKPHLIWMDMRMPVMDGYEATRAIRALEQQDVEEEENNNSSPTNPTPTNRTKIIALTASVFEEQQAKILAAGCDDLVHKPWQESVLFDKMAQHLGVRYIYEEEANEGSNAPQLAAPRKLIPDDLSVMPLEWIAQLHQATLCADEPLILQLLEQIPAAEVSLGHALKDLVDNFRLDLLLDLTQKFNHE